MEMTTRRRYINKQWRLFFNVLFTVFSCCSLSAQQALERYIIKDGKMLIELSKQASEATLDSFIAKYDLYDLDLKQFLKTNSTDSLRKLGWKLEKNNQEMIVISKLLKGFDNFKNPADKIILTEKNPLPGEFSPVNSNIKFGFNSFRKKYPFLVKDSVVTFFLRENNAAKKVLLAGSFTNWQSGAIAMQQVDSGWIANVKLGVGKYWYKFIVDGHWTVDKDNTRVENDGRGNDNSVFFKPNVIFKLAGFADAKKVFVAGSFNDWQPGRLQMINTGTSWQLPIYLADGTHTYRFIVDGKWMADPGTYDKLPNEFNDFNSVIRLGVPYKFTLPGYLDAKKVILTGSFNKWKENELYMTKTATGWELPYTLGKGNYLYRYKVDGKWVNPAADEPDNTDRLRRKDAYLIVDANYTFRLKGFDDAKSVFLAGDFNDWSPNTFAMEKQNGEWVLKVHLSRGKRTYKFVVDGKWIKDPFNKLWEQNEFNTGNSVVWFDQGQ